MKLLYVKCDKVVCVCEVLYVKLLYVRDAM